ncbi:cytochrome P450 [Lasiosphaeria miniovina]|uniref:Cytochrome P450 n=1 Tax=Lasiosphaeria miniovina TaxID=1954250 RepID=A0AA40A6L5_9PEZI|nr:cytochrome P450 [Lasiosphaeria miniovina]KAK0710113.1 cytochrome P450 [Lasiosphaeria miniovina]
MRTANNVVVLNSGRLVRELFEKRGAAYSGHLWQYINEWILGTSVIANVWHTHHSADDYDDPDEFVPERFLAHPFGMRPDAAHDPARLEGSGPRLTYAFGAGRRICPGMDSARQNLVLGLAKVLWAFDVLPPDNGDEIGLDIETGFISDLVLRPRRFDVSLKLREGRTKEILDHYHQAYEGQAEVMS